MHDSWRRRRRNPIRPINRHCIQYRPGDLFPSTTASAAFGCGGVGFSRALTTAPGRCSAPEVRSRCRRTKGWQLKRIKTRWRWSASKIYIDGLEPWDKRHDSRARVVFYPAHQPDRQLF